MNLASARRSGKTRQIFHLKLGVLFIPILFSSSPKFAESPAWEIRQKGHDVVTPRRCGIRETVVWASSEICAERETGHSLMSALVVTHFEFQDIANTYGHPDYQERDHATLTICFFARVFRQWKTPPKELPNKSRPALLGSGHG